LNYPTPVDVGKVMEGEVEEDKLVNVANSIKSREFTSTYDHAHIPNPIESK